MNHLIFKTNQANAHGIQKIDAGLRQLGIVSWSLNFADSNHPLRVTARNVAPGRIIETLRQAGIDCELLTF